MRKCSTFHIHENAQILQNTSGEDEEVPDNVHIGLVFTEEKNADGIRQPARDQKYQAHDRKRPEYRRRDQYCKPPGQNIQDHRSLFKPIHVDYIQRHSQNRQKRVCYTYRKSRLSADYNERERNICSEYQKIYCAMIGYAQDLL